MALLTNQNRLPLLKIQFLYGLFISLFLMHMSLFGQNSIELNPIGTYATGIFADGAAEIVSHDPNTQRLFVVNGANGTIDVIDISLPSTPVLAFTIDMSPYGKQANSVAVHKGLVAAAIENIDKQAPGTIAFFDTDGNFINQVTAGALPDMIAFTPNGLAVLVANEGEPDADYLNDPEGSVTIVYLKKGAANITQDDVKTADFTAFNTVPLEYGVRIFGPGASVAQDVEPEYIAISKNSKTAYVSLQENNAIAVVDIKEGVVVDILGLGFKDHSQIGNGFDPSNSDGIIDIHTNPTFGMYQPDAIAYHQINGQNYLITANEGDSREYEGNPGFIGETRVKDLTLDPMAFPDGDNLKLEENLGRLKVTITNGDTDGDGDYDQLYSYGARSFSIWKTNGDLVFDSGDQLEQITAAMLPNDFNSDDEENDSFDDRSDDKGPEPEGVAIGKIDNRFYLFLGLERIGGIAVYDITDVTTPVFLQYINTRNFNGDPEAGTAGDMSPEGLAFIPKSESPVNKPLLVVAYEVSGTTTVFEINSTYATKAGNNEALTDNRQIDKTPTTFKLEQNYPNPFNPTTQIGFSLQHSDHVSVTIYNSLGQEIRTLTSRQYEAGNHSISWDGRNNNGEQAGSGIYLYKLQSSSNVAIRQMNLVK